MLRQTIRAVRSAKEHAKRAKFYCQSRSYAKIGLFGDIHFQDKGLERITTTGDWIIDQFKQRQVDAVVCLGDVLNTREVVSVRSLSSALAFFDKMNAVLNEDVLKEARKGRAIDENKIVPIHVILGNHDMNLRHSSKISSLDALSMNSLLRHQFIQLHRDLTLTSVKGVSCFMMPYHEDQTDVVAKIEELIKKRKKKLLANTIGFGHLAINGAIQNSSSSRYKGPIGPDAFNPLKRTFSGHFHAHHALDKVVYVGAPVQFNFGDAEQDRGIVIYDTETDQFEFLKNPHGDQYFKVKYSEIDRVKQNIEQYRDTFLMIQYEDLFVTPQQHQALVDELLEFGVLGVKKDVQIIDAIKNPDTDSAITSQQSKKIDDLLEEFINHVHTTFVEVQSRKKKSTFEGLLDNKDKIGALTELGKSIVADSRVQSIDSHEGKAFDGTLSSLSITDFMGVQGTLHIDFKNMNDGIWIIEGANGSGKSQIFEALVWCQFGGFLRSGMSKDYCINDEAKECMVVLEYANGLIIERTRKRGKADVLRTFQRREGVDEPEYLAENEKGELSQTQKVLNDLLGIDYETFTKSVVLGQNIVSNFVSGNKDQRRSIIEETLGLDKFNAYFETAKTKRSALEARLNELLQTQTALQQELKLLSATIKSTNDRITAKTAERQTVEQERSSRVEGREDARKDLERQVAQLTQQKSQIEAQQHELTNQSTDTPSTIKGRSVNEWKTLRDELVVRLNHMHEYSLDEKNCPRCGQPIDESHHAKLLEENHEFLTRVTGTHDTTHNSADLFKVLQQLRGDMERDIDAVERTEVQAMRQRLELSERVKDVERALADKEQQLLRYQNQLVVETSDLDRRLHYLDAEIDQLTASIAQHETRVTQLNDQLTALTADHSHVAEQYSMARFWEVAFDKNTKSTMGFETVRSYIFADLIKELNLVLDSYADQLSDSGKVTVTLTSELELEEVYVKRSGGERKRTDLAVLFSLFELVRNRSRYQPQYLMLDEVFDALDRTGQLQVQQVLSSLANRLRKVFVITHVTELSRGISIAGTINVQMKREREFVLGSELTVNTV